MRAIDIVVALSVGAVLGVMISTFAPSAEAQGKPFTAYRSGHFCVFVTYNGSDIAVSGPHGDHARCN